jgi:hypothetical protein
MHTDREILQSCMQKGLVLMEELLELSVIKDEALLTRRGAVNHAQVRKEHLGAAAVPRGIGWGCLLDWGASA